MHARAHTQEQHILQNTFPPYIIASYVTGVVCACVVRVCVCALYVLQWLPRNYIRGKGIWEDSPQPGAKRWSSEREGAMGRIAACLK